MLCGLVDTNVSEEPDASVFWVELHSVIQED